MPTVALRRVRSGIKASGNAAAREGTADVAIEHR
jgi:hypothetical protein